MKGYLALDIDGTLTGSDHMIPDEVAGYLAERHREGWEVTLITGRTFSFAMRTIDKLRFPFYLVVQNGADILHMPSKKTAHRVYMVQDEVAAFHELCMKEGVPNVIYAGVDFGDFCYYHPPLFPEKLAPYVKRRKALSAEPWREFHAFDEVEQKAFPLLHAVGTEEKLDYLTSRLLLNHSLEVSTIIEPFQTELSLMMVTAPEANKGTALRKVQELVGKERPAIAAGNDKNDIPLLKAADYGVAIGNPPKGLRDVADYIAPPAEEMGIIEGLNHAISQF